MKKYLLAAFLLGIGMFSAFAQRLIKGQKGVELSAGLISNKSLHDNYYIQAGVVINAKKGDYQFWAVEYSHRLHQFESYSIPAETYSGEGGYSKCVLTDRSKTVLLHLGISAVAGYEVFNRNESVLPNGAVIQNNDSFIYGGGLRLSLETYLSDHWLVFIRGRTKVIFGTSMEHFRPSAGAGLCFIF